MKLSGLLELLRERPAYQALLDALQSDIPSWRGRTRPLQILKSARPYLVAALAQHLRRPILVVTGRPQRAVQLHTHLRQWLPASEVHLFSAADPLPYEKVPWGGETIFQRLSALSALAPYFASTPAQAGGEEPPIVVTSARALLSLTIPRREFILGLRVLRQGQQVNLVKLLESLVSMGYQPAQLVEEPGTFSRRGGIIDLFPPTERWPVRMELFGDEIDSLRQFDPSTQRSMQSIPAVTLVPANEALPKFGPQAAERLEHLALEACQTVAAMDFRRDIERLAAGETFKGIEFYLPYLYSQPGRLLDYLPDAGLLIVEDMAELDEAAREFMKQAEDNHQTVQRTGDLPPDFAATHWDWEQEKERVAARADLDLGYGLEAEEESLPPLAELFTPAPHYGGRLKQIVSESDEMARAGERVVIVSRQARRLAELFLEAGRPIAEVEEITQPPIPGTITLLRGVLSEGWMLDHVWPAESDAPTAPATILLTDTELFGWSKPESRQRRRARGLSPEAFFSDVSPGDYVVHVEHGIGIYRGLVRMTVDGIEREYLQVDYAAGDRLFVPVHQADRLARYVGPGEGAPPLSRLGTGEWEQTKARAQKAVRDLARELLELYAARATAQGHAFQPDTPWQAEMEEAFPYTETSDQLMAIEEVKADMERPLPMDRLICGDVGYGKTEVALRSAFKAVMDGKQVAVLVPTTVLAQQHYKRFQERLAAFPVIVEMLSRFRSRQEQERILQELAAGKIDIIIGTHRLLQKDVKFKDLGLVIIDEEQRFGVAHKERLKQLRKEVDVLTLTATPIPRTLHMSLVGLRDMSTIDTPPEDRLPIKTVLAPYDDNLVRQAILRELERGGQVYFVHNRVQGIEVIARKLQKLVPEATLAIAHGQMPERELAQVMWDFANGEYDVLVCTTIIESGIDIPNVNTIIINRADTFGLAQLYQLRGRVGRGAVRAYAYLLYDKHHPLSPVARRRLEAIAEATELGAGFRIALEDLEIRGAGEILGARQHGHIAAIGLDMYSRLLSQAIQELREGRAPDEEEPKRKPGAGWRRPQLPKTIGADQPLVLIDLPLVAYIPESYIPEEPLRLQMYRRLAELSTHAEIDELAAELRDRFGPLPVEVENLFFQLHVRADALQLGIEAIVRENNSLVIRCIGLELIDRDALQQKLGSAVKVARRHIAIPLDEQGIWREVLTKVLSELAVAA